MTTDAEGIWINGNSGHDGRCQCGAVIPCEESDCIEAPGHEYVCAECLARERQRPERDELAQAERMHDN